MKNEVKKANIKLRNRGQVTLPKAFLEELDVNEGDTLELRLDNNGVMTLVPTVQIPKDQAWFFTEKWQKEDKEAQKDIEEGHVYVFENAHDAIDWLDSDDEKDEEE
ncbi:AbrB/MazE/SpoVT family DNA-binding domain-containing protein [Bacillus carboniphilus]|uniref:AbrB/MazE/SpoVT family DNA-binding domain-containing protein n=1 Tax=Bacillus carboniphilus TaxID=86663 RepID=A0ABY9JX12_9BACI|nr:AbrB/MazE/SpoVT family DNA-binding domain-containing protein [Bacillus carboniphilus]WLR42211.1 AbrB/MazE/SpoVT family DNA-binding domain-containing protein [Bacillus carboniphilus]